MAEIKTRVNYAYVPGGDSLTDDSEAVASAKNELDSDYGKQVLNWLMVVRDEEKDLQLENRIQQSIDEDFDDHIQWSNEDTQVLNARGQKAIVMNKIKPATSWLIGTERKTRLDFNVVPRTADDVDGAVKKTKTLKYVHDVNKARYQRSRAFEDAVKVGVGWLEDGICQNEEAEPLFSLYTSWRDNWFDSRCFAIDYPSKARYHFRKTKLDLDIAIAMLPDRADILKIAAQSTGNSWRDDDEWYWLSTPVTTDEDGHLHMSTNYNITSASDQNTRGTRQMVDIWEAWFRMPVPAGTKALKIDEAYGKENPKIKTQNHNVIYDETDEQHKWMVDNGYATLTDTTRMQVYFAMFVDGHLLQLMRSPYKHNRIPFIPVWGYRRGRDGMPYGIIRGMRSPQEDLNKRHSKALHLLSSRQVVYEKGSIDDIDLFMDELASVDGAMEVNDKAKIELVDNTQVAASQIRMMEMDSAYMIEASGITQANLGNETNATSGKAITALQSQGATSSFMLFDNNQLSCQIEGEIQLSLVEQFYTEEKVLRLTGANGKTEFEVVNKQLEDGSIENDITATQADFVLSVKDYRESVRAAMAETIMQVIQGLPPEIAIKLLDVAIDMFDFETKDELVKRIREINGMKDPAEESEGSQGAQGASQEPQALGPNGEPQPPSPEQQAQAQAEQQQAQLADMQMQMQIKQAELSLLELDAKIKKLQAETNLINEKAKTEQVTQGVKAHGVDYDEREMNVREAQTVSSIKDKELNRTLDSFVKADNKQQGVYQERGLKTNNIEGV